MYNKINMAKIGSLYKIVENDEADFMPVKF